MSRNITKRIDLNELEAKTLKMKADQCHLSEGEYLRELIMSSQPVEAPPRQFYVQMEKVNWIASTIQRICATAQDKEGIAELKSLYVQLIGHIVEIKILSTSRSRNVSFVIVLQDKQQIEAIFEKYFRTIYGNCAWQLFLGSLELETCKYYSELLGKETIHAYTYTKNYGRQGGSSRQEQLIERDLMKPDEIRALPKRECVLYTPYYGVVRDLKYDMTRHPFYDQVSDGNGVPPYVWGEANLAVGSVRVLDSTYAGELTVLPKANGVLLEVED